MTDLKTIHTVSLTSATAEKMSRHEMLEWVNSTVHGSYKKIEELCSGVAYCQMMELLFPNVIGLKRIKCHAKLEHEFLHNLKLFQSAFTKLKYNKSVPIDRLMKAKFQDNFEFLQWFKKFFDTFSAGKENLKIPEALDTVALNSSKPLRKWVSQQSGPKLSSTNVDALNTPKSDKQPQERTISPSSQHVLQETLQQLTEQVLRVGLERNNYYKKLTEIETILNDSVKNDVQVKWCNRALAILYEIDDNGTPGNIQVPEIGAEKALVVV